MRDAEEIIAYLRAHPKLAATEDYELCVQHSTGHLWKFNGDQETGRGSDENIWVGLRVLQRKQPGYSSGFASGKVALDEIVAKAVFASTLSDPDPWFRFPVTRQTGDINASVPLPPAPVPGEDLSDPQIESSWFQWRGTGHLLRRLEKKEVRYPHYFERCEIRHKPKLETAEEFRETADSPIWVHSRVMSQWLAIIGDWFCADRVLCGLSPLAGRKGQKIFSESLYLKDGENERQRNQVPVDLEGVGPQPVQLVSAGQLEGLLHSSRTAAMENRPSTGHYLRFPEEVEGRIRPLSLCILPGKGQADPLAQFDEGYTLEFLEELSPLNQNAIAFRGVGRRIHSGRPGAWVSMRSANCDLFALLTRIVAVGKDLSSFGNFGSPSILFQEMPLSITR
ncbi:MAG: hypothetical protein H6617_01545 [Bdellovibrionaceae bacterium]|nr:hypothetical protein [Bdellovibrionales bacterium]MCB9253350.1 hypothetical protein [Pseudobdellovibrionaceae bacterium]